MDGVDVLWVRNERTRPDESLRVLAVEAAATTGSRPVVVVVPVVVAGAGLEADGTDAFEQADGERRLAGVDALGPGDEECHLREPVVPRFVVGVRFREDERLGVVQHPRDGPVHEHVLRLDVEFGFGVETLEESPDP